MNIDALIAEKLFGKKPGHDIWQYSTNPMRVVDILEALRKKGFVTGISYEDRDGKPHCWIAITKVGVNKFYRTEEATLPLALCKAALMALEGK